MYDMFKEKLKFINFLIIKALYTKNMYIKITHLLIILL
jgi:hypothetical protein